MIDSKRDILSERTMGVKDLFEQVASFAEESFFVWEKLKLKKVGIDVSVWMYIFAAQAQKNSNHDKPFDAGNIAAMIMKRVHDMKNRHAIIPILVFDGAVTVAKKMEAKRREEQRAKRIVAECERSFPGEEEGDGKPKFKNKPATTKLFGSIDKVLVRDELVKSCRQAGITYFVSPGEADHQLVHLIQANIIDYVISVDSDLLCHKGMKLIRFGNRGGFFHGRATIYNLNQSSLGSVKGNTEFHALCTILVEQKRLAPDESFWRLCLAYALMAGNDYGTVHGVGKGTALKILKELIEREDFQIEHLLDAEKIAQSGKKIADKVKFDVDALKLVKNYFLNALVYFPESGKVAPLNDPCGTCVVGGSETALRIVQGFQCLDDKCKCKKGPDNWHISKDLEQIKMITRVHEREPTNLTFDMVEGSVLKKDPMFCSKATLERFLKTRDLPVSDDGEQQTREMLINKVQGQLAWENEYPDKVRLRCPDGRSLYTHLLLQGKKTVVTPQFDSELYLKVQNTSLDQWTTSQKSINDKCPMIDDFTFIQKYYVEKKGFELQPGKKLEDFSHRVLKEGLARTARRTHLNMGLLQLSESEWVFRVDVPRSMHAGEFRTYVMFRSRKRKEEEYLSRVEEVLAIWCPCKAGQGGGCVHGSAVLQVIFNLFRHPDVFESESCTSGLCAWNTPNLSTLSKSQTMQPLHALRFVHVKPQKRKIRESICHSDMPRASKFCKGNIVSKSSAPAIIQQLFTDYAVDKGVFLPAGEDAQNN